VSLPLPSAGNTSSQHEAVDGTEVVHLVVVVVAGTLIMTASFCFVPSSPEQLDVAEQRLLNFCSTKLRRCKIGPLHCIETVSETLYQRTDDKPTLVLLAGYGMGAATWYNVIDALASRFHVICVDRIGDGQSDRFSLLSNSIEETESLFVEALEQWREARGLARFILLGHSFGGYIAALYTLKYGHRVSQLVLASPLGVPARDAGSAARWEARIGKLGFSVLRFGWETVGVNAQALLRGLGPLGPMATWRGMLSPPYMWVVGLIRPHLQTYIFLSPQVIF
jgi:pimeloyl-ACP methyl ester carboxylesterase